MFGYRARVGYTVPISAVEVFPFEFYQMAPAGVTLMVATSPAGLTDREQTYALGAAVAREMAEAGVNVIVIGGATHVRSLGLDQHDEQARTIEREYGIPVTNARAAQLHALRELGARRLGIVTPFAVNGRAGTDRFAEDGFEVVGVDGAGYSHADFGRCPTDAPATVARRLAAEHPEADTIVFPAAHWPAASNVEVLEQELGINVVSSAQAIVWKALRECKIADAIDGYGRLLREH